VTDINTDRDLVQFVFRIEDRKGRRSTGGYDPEMVPSPRGKLWDSPQAVRSHLMNSGDSYPEDARVVVYALDEADRFTLVDFHGKISRERQSRADSQYDGRFFGRNVHTPFFRRLAAKWLELRGRSTAN
jgi:hypothetical protein